MPLTRSLSPLLIAIAVTVLAIAFAPHGASAQDTGWVIQSFDATYEVNRDGTVSAVEDIRVDFRALQRHGIFRDIPVEYTYDESNNRLIELTNISVDDGANPVEWRIDSERPNLRIRIGDPDVTVTGQQRYRIHYTINDGLNPFPEHDEFFWNVTGNDWPVTMQSASATVVLPDGGIERVTCYEGPTGSTAPCQSSFDFASAQYSATGDLLPQTGLTIVVAIEKGAVSVGPPVLVSSSVDVWDEIRDFMGLKPLPLAIAGIVFLVVAGVIFRLWWTAGRDRWYGRMAHVVEGAADAQERPWGAHEPVVVEYTPPTTPPNGRAPQRPLRPAEIGVLIDERADTLDVTATIVDLAVRKHLRIVELESGGIFGFFKKQDYQLEKLENPEDNLLPYEQQLLTALFDGMQEVKLSDLRNKFYKDLARVKESLYGDSVRDLKFFPQNPETIRNIYRIVGVAVAVAGGGLVYLLGTQFGAGIVGVSILLAGGLLLLVSNAMPRRTASGRQAYRRALGFRLYMETAETDRQRFAESANIFHEYLPYAIVFECVDKWAEVFEDLGLEPQAHYYAGRRGFAPSRFARNMSSFSASISTAMASTPGGSGGSGFGGGGGSGGGGGGGGGGSW